MHSPHLRVVGPAFVVVASAASSGAQSQIYSLEGQSKGDRMGVSVAAMGDMNGDGLGDFLVGSPHEYDHGLDAGAVRLYAGASSLAIRVWFGEAAGDKFGSSVAGAGDLDADGMPDAVVGAPHAKLSGASSGRVLALSGALGAPALFGANGLGPGDVLGFSVAGVGDVNADGYPDVAAGAPEMSGIVGYAAGKGYVQVLSGRDGSVLHTLALAVGAAFGYSVAGPGDVDGDGHADVAVGAAWPDVHVFSGASGASLLTIDDCRAAPASCYGYPGQASRLVAAVGDLDGDGRGDLAIGWRPLHVEGQPDGRVRTWSGASGAFLYEIPSVPGSGQGKCGRSLAGVPDVDGDGTPELAIGGYRSQLVGPDWWPALFGPGFALLSSGASGALLFQVEVGQQKQYHSVFNGAQHELFGAAVGGTDVNGDGVGDVIVGQPGKGATSHLTYDGFGGAVVLSGSKLGLTANLHVLSLAHGGTQKLEIGAGPAFAWKWFWLVGSLSGTSPGLAIGGAILPLNPDAYLAFGLANPNKLPLVNSLGPLDVAGHAFTHFLLPPGSDPALLHATVHHAYGVLGADGTVVFTSNPVPLTFVD